MKYRLLFILTLLFLSCNSRKDNSSSNNKIDLGKVESFRYGAGDVITQGYLDTKGNLWFTTTSEGVYKYNGTEFIKITELEGLCSNNVSSVIEGENGIFWFATSKGLCKYDGSKFVNIPLPEGDSLSVSPKTGFPSRTTKYVLNLTSDREGNLWLGTDASGAYKYDGKRFTSFLRFEGKLQHDNYYNNCISSILEDNSGNIWFTSMTHGAINRFDGKEMINFNTKDGILGDMISSSFQDSSGNIWFGSIQNLQGGISRWDGNSFTNFTVKDGLCDSNVVCFYEDESGDIWIGTGNGVCFYDGDVFTNFEFKGKPLGDIRFIVKDNEDNMWFGGRYGVLWKYDGNELKDYTLVKKGSNSMANTGNY